MRKTTEELANAAVSELNDDAFDFNGLSASDKEMLLRWFETFRRLVIENERECAEAVGVTASLPGTNNGYTFVAFNGSDVPVGTKLFTFPPAAQVPGWQPIETAPKCSSTVVLGFDPNWYDIAIPMFWSEKKNSWRFYQIDDEIRPTHWMPLPAAPEVKP